MMNIKNTICLLAVASLSYVSEALPERRSPEVTPAPEYKPHSCYSYTTTVPYTGKMHCPNMTTCGPHPMCIMMTTTTITVPFPNPKCPKTPTVTATAPGACPTCQKGCATTTLTETVTGNYAEITAV